MSTPMEEMQGLFLQGATPYDPEQAMDDVGLNDDGYRYSDDELAAIIQQEIQSSNTEWNSSVATQREEAYLAYYGIDKRKGSANRSRHVSMEVFDSVESIKAKMLRTFTSNRQTVQFDPLSESDVESAAQATAYVNSIFHRSNNGYRILSDSFHDALLSKQCCIKRYWKEDIARIPEEFTDVPEESLFAMLEQEQDVDLLEITEERIEVQEQQTPMGVVTSEVNLMSGQIERSVDRSHVAVEVVAPEDVFIDGDADSIETAKFFGQKFEKTVSDLIKEGYDEELVDGLAGSDSISLNFEEASRHAVDSTYQFGKGSADNERRLITCYEAYIEIDLNDDGVAEWWQIIIAGNEVLHKERVAEVPYEYWSPIMLSHKTIGMSIADVTMDIQRTSSSVLRGWVDNIWMTNTSRTIANLSVIKNPRDLIDNPIGGVIDTSDPMGAVMPLPTPTLNSSTGALYELLNQQKEQRTGDTRLGKGMNTDALSKQNSGDMIEGLTNAANERIMQMARSFAEVCYKPLMHAIYRIGVENGQIVNAEVSGQHQELNPEGWALRNNLSVDVALTPDESDNKAQALLTLHSMMAQDPEMSLIYGLNQKYAVFNRAFDLMGMKSPAFVANPSSPEVQQQMMQQQQQQQMMQQMQQQMMMQQQQLAEFGEETKRLRVMMDSENKEEHLEYQAVKAADEQALDERRFEHEEKMDYAEVALEANQQRPVAI